MTNDRNSLSKIPTHIITGFLGVGKTSAILHFLKQKPKDQLWAIIVNEFGEIGVDGSLFEGQTGQEEGVFIREVPGGCMCCTAGVSMKKALNVLLSKVNPDRVLIEPTGLGHPSEVVQTLKNKTFRDTFSVQKVITVVDARLVSYEFYAEHSIFKEQIAIADLVVGNKSDLYKPKDTLALHRYVETFGMSNVDIIFTQQGVIALDHLEGCPHNIFLPNEIHHHDEIQKLRITELPFPDSGVIKVENHGEGFKSVGWRFASDKIFDKTKLLTTLSAFEVERMKAVFITLDGAVGFNLAKDCFSEIELDICHESRIEIISRHIDIDWEAQLMRCMVAAPV